jgi:uncharacterized protein
MSLNPGGRPGGEVKFLVGLVLAGIGLWFFFDSVRLTTGYHGLITGLVGSRMAGLQETTSMGIILAPLFIGVVALFFDVRQTWAWIVTIIGLLILVIEIISRMRPEFHIKASSGILMLAMIAGGFGLMLRGYVEDRRNENKKS